jgi:hypothetical protein
MEMRGWMESLEEIYTWQERTCEFKARLLLLEQNIQFDEFTPDRKMY